MIELSYKRKAYQEDMIKHVENKDNIVELGCHIGTSTKILSKLAMDGTIYAFDNSPESEVMNNLGYEYNNIEFYKRDVRKEDTIKELVKICDIIDVLCIDLGGGYHPDTVFKVYFIWSSFLKPRVTLIRNQGLIDFINSSKTNENISSNKGYLQSSYENILPKDLKELEFWSNKL